MIIRSGRKDNFTVINNSVINDKNLDWKELGLLIYLLSKPDNWKVCPVHLAKQRKTGRDGIYAILKKLRSSGYIQVSKNQDGSTDWTVFDSPYTENTDKAISPHTEKPDMEKPDMAFPTLVNTECLINTYNTTTTTENTKELNGGGGDLIIFSKQIRENELAQAREMLSRINIADAQRMADVLSALVDAGEIRKNPIAVLGGLIRRYQDGTFDPSTGIHIKSKREAKMRNVKQVKQEEQVDHDAVMANLERMREKQKQTQVNIKA